MSDDQDNVHFPKLTSLQKTKYAEDSDVVTVCIYTDMKTVYDVPESSLACRVWFDKDQLCWIARNANFEGHGNVRMKAILTWFDKATE